MESINALTEQFKRMTLDELKQVDELLDAEIVSRGGVHADGGTNDPDNDGDNDGGLPDDPTHDE